ncbi:MAG: hypothetical protein QM539_09610, partial [Alphaproteobacteria bacterium]|nr:hypothetical protein [Alphaproteobacteria bacterium]
LTNKYHIWASTLDKQDVDVMRDRIKNGANLLEDHVFQFDFLNDDFTKLPLTLQDIINNPATRKKLVIYINPPYAEVSTVIGRGKKGVNQSNIHKKYTETLGTAGREIYIQFITRIYFEIKDCIIAEFSKLKALQGSAFSNFRNFFDAKLIKIFIIPADTFDNVKGKFPIGFKIWDTKDQNDFKKIKIDIFNYDSKLQGKKTLKIVEKYKYVNQWISQYKAENDFIGFLAGTNGNDFQTNNLIYILNRKNQMLNPRGIWISSFNLIAVSVYFTVRHSIKANWINDRDQFLYPNKKWEHDTEFQNDCLSFTLFHSQNKITCQAGINHWIPFTEYVVGAREKFKSNFMTDYIKGKDPFPKIVSEPPIELFGNQKIERTTPLEFSKTAQEVFRAGLKLWQYYHEQPNCNVNAALYDIKAHFQGRSTSGKMNNVSQDNTYTKLLSNLKDTLNILAQKIEPKVYEYGFLLE